MKAKTQKIITYCYAATAVLPAYLLAITWESPLTMILAYIVTIATALMTADRIITINMESDQ